MAEYHSNLYFNHADKDLMDQLQDLFVSTEGSIEEFKEVAGRINADASDLVDDLFSESFDPENDFNAESVSEEFGYKCLHFVHGGNGDDVIEGITRFLSRLVSGIHVQAWGCGDDDPWEYWIKIENGCIERKDDEPFLDDDDAEILRTVYTWWHITMPPGVREGLIEDLLLDNEHIVFTGKMEKGTREQMEQLARVHGAITQKTLNRKSTMLVIGARPGESKLSKAEELGVEVVSEEEFYEVTGAGYLLQAEKPKTDLLNLPAFKAVKNIKIRKGSEILPLIKKDSFIGIPLEEISRLIESGEQIKYKDEGVVFAFNVGEYTGGQVMIYSLDEIDVSYEDVAKLMKSFGFTDDEQIKSVLDSNEHLNSKGSFWDWYIGEFRLRVQLRLSEDNGYALMHNCIYGIRPE